MLYWLIYILLEAFIQYKSIKAGNKPSYLVLFIIRGMFSIFHGILLNVQPQNNEYLILVGFQTCSFWIIFDLVLNFLRGEKWNYKGENSGILDHLAYWEFYTLKVIAFAGIFFFYIKGLHFWSF